MILTMYFQTYFLTPWILPEDNTKVSIISDGSRRKEVKPRTFKSKSFCCHDNVQQIAINDHYKQSRLPEQKFSWRKISLTNL